MNRYCSIRLLVYGLAESSECSAYMSMSVTMGDRVSHHGRPYPPIVFTVGSR